MFMIFCIFILFHIGETGANWDKKCNFGNKSLNNGTEIYIESWLFTLAYEVSK